MGGGGIRHICDKSSCNLDFCVIVNDYDLSVKKKIKKYCTV